MESIKKTEKQIEEIFKRRQIAVLGACKLEAEEALQEFQVNQPASPGTHGKYWDNQTGQAAAMVFSGAELTDKGARWFLAHGVLYGIYLELANDRRHAALKPIIEERLTRFMWRIGEFYKPDRG